MHYRNRTSGTVSTQGEIRRANSNMSFPRVWDADVCALLNIDPVLATPKPSHTTLEQVNTSSPVQDALGNWVQGWEVAEKFSDTTDNTGKFTSKAENEASFEARETALLEANVRTQRDKLIEATDWSAGSDLTMSSEMTTYRQDLRDVPEQSGFPETIMWPTLEQPSIPEEPSIPEGPK